MLKTSINRFAFLAGVILATVSSSSSSSPPNTGNGNYVYDPNSIPQNEKILNLFVRLAAHTANQLMLLKMKLNRDPTSYEDEKKFGQAPDLLIIEENGKTLSSVAEDSRNRDETKDSRVLINDSNHSRDNLGKNTLKDFLKDKIGPGIEARRKSDDLEAQDGQNEEVKRLQNPLDSRLVVKEPTNLVYEDPSIPKIEEQGGVELENRALFNFEKNNYVTHYTDQSTKIQKADATVNNFGAERSGNIVINQQAGSGLAGIGNFGISGQGSSASGAFVNQIAGSSGSLGIANVGHSSTRNQAVAMIQNSASSHNSASSASSSFEKNLGVNMNRDKTETAKLSAGLNSQNHKLEAGQISASDFHGVFAQAGASVGLDATQKIQSANKPGVTEFRKEVTLQLISNEKSPSLNTDFQNTGQKPLGKNVHDLRTSSKASLKHDIQSSVNLESNVGGLQGEIGTKNHQDTIIQGQLNGQLMHQEESKLLQGLRVEEKRHGELNSLKISQGIGSGGHSFAEQQGLGAEAQIHHVAGFENSGQLSSSSSLSKDTMKGAFGNGFSLGGQIGIGLKHNLQGSTSSEKKELGNLDHVRGSISAAAKVQAGGILKVETEKGLSAGLGLFNEKIDLVKGAIKSKAHFGGKLDLSGHVLTR